MLKINVITLFPNLFTEHLNNLPFKKALDLGMIEVNLINIREFAVDNRGSVDDKPYGGGAGMLLRIEPVVGALRSVNAKNKILLSPKGEKFTQEKALELANKAEITLICGRYEGVDARIEEHYVDELISIGDYVLSGGEVPALVIMESVTRLMEGMFDKENVTTDESHSKWKYEYPQYTKPDEFEGHRVPEILKSGDHKLIEKWRNSKSTIQQ